MNFEAIIGLELHVEMKTKSKMFSSSPNGFTHLPNTHVTAYDMAFPGSMPVVNKQAVINAIRVAHALHMTIDHTLYFDRKNYFYADLPKGYQITQQFRPIGKDGYLEFINEDGSIKRINIERVHMEEDTCKQLHFSDYSLLDYNRAGVPLLEIVSCPEIRNGYEAMKYVETIRNIVIYSGTSDGKMEEGSLRCDVNISLRPTCSDTLGTKVEIKNINSLKNIQLALDYEIARQALILDEGGSVIQETRRFDERSGKTVSMRIKTDAVDYKYFCEPNIAPIALSGEFIQNAIDTCPELYDAKMKRYLSWGLSKTDAEILLSDIETSKYYESAAKDGNLAKVIANFVIVEIRGYLRKNEIAMTEFPLPPEQLLQIAKMQQEGYSHQQCTAIFYELCQNGGEVEEVRSKLMIEKQSSDDELILHFVKEVLDANPQSIEDFKAGKDRAAGFLVGQVMKLAKGKVNPAIVAKIVNDEIKKR